MNLFDSIFAKTQFEKVPIPHFNISVKWKLDVRLTWFFPWTKSRVNQGVYLILKPFYTILIQALTRELIII